MWVEFTWGDSNAFPGFIFFMGLKKNSTLAALWMRIVTTEKEIEGKLDENLKSNLVTTRRFYGCFWRRLYSPRNCMHWVRLISAIIINKSPNTVIKKEKVSFIHNNPWMYDLGWWVDPTCSKCSSCVLLLYSRLKGGSWSFMCSYV